MRNLKKFTSVALSSVMALSIISMNASALNESIVVTENLPFTNGEAEVTYMDINSHTCTDENGNIIPAEHLNDGKYEISPYITIYESENNGSISTSDQTYSNYDNVGAISTAGDEDYWKLTFDETGTGVGSANFWLGNVPSDCNYRMTIFENAGGNRYNAYVVDFNKDGGQELLQNFDVFTGIEYYIRIDSATYDKSSSQYLMRVRQL